MKRTILFCLLGITVITLVVYLLFLAIRGKKNQGEGKTLELTYTINAGIPYKWEYEIEDKSIVEFVKSYVIEDKNVGGMTGAPVSTNYVFKGKKEGKTTITFKKVSVVDGSVAEESKNTVKVDKNKNLSLIALP